MNELQTLLHHLEVSIRDKGYNRVEIRAFVEPTRIWYSIEYYVHSSDSYADGIRSYAYDIPQLTASVGAIPARIDVLREQFLGRLASLVEDAESLELNIPELRPLFETYRNNELTYAPSPLVIPVGKP